ncbi:MAG: HpcH/HpaI aldolase/citrate lyase family protein [Methylococcales bacterium]|nr:HpcH/HpaI aldolase/citrate lyase family protein [Methylococcales bacterium]
MNNSLLSTHERFFSPWCLGSPLYMPAHRRDLMEIANGDKHPELRSVIFCTEDALSHAEVDSSLRHLGLCLQGFRPTVQRYRFIRARNPDVLARLLDLPHIEKIDGFVLPKFNNANFQAYFDQLKGTSFKIMPTLETKEVFDVGAMQALRQAFLQDDIFERILMLRIGGNDLMNLLGIRRMRGLTLYDTPLSAIISNLVTVFKPDGFALSAPVFEYLDDPITLQKELRLDLAHGLAGKTAIHPTQVPMIEAAYRVDVADVDMAQSLMDVSAPAVFKMHNAMCEVATHKKWAKEIIDRQLCYGINESMALTDYTGLSI